MLSLCRTVREIIISQLPAGLTEAEKRKREFIKKYKETGKEIYRDMADFEKENNCKCAIKYLTNTQAK